MFDWVRFLNSIEHNQTDWVRLSSICSIEFDLFGNRTHWKCGVRFRSIEFDFRTFDLLCRVTRADRLRELILVSQWPHGKTIEGCRLWELQKLINNSVSGSCQAGLVVGKEISLSCYRSSTVLHTIFINEPLGQCALLFKCWCIWIRLWAVAYESLKTKEKSSWVIPKVSFLLQSLTHSSNGGFTKMVITRVCRLREWSQGELRL